MNGQLRQQSRARQCTGVGTTGESRSPRVPGTDKYGSDKARVVSDASRAGGIGGWHVAWSVATQGRDLAEAVLGWYVRHRLARIREGSKLGSTQQGRYDPHFTEVRAVDFRW